MGHREIKDNSHTDPAGAREREPGPEEAPARRDAPTPSGDGPPPGTEDWGSPRIIHKAISPDALDRDAVSVIRRLTRKGHTAYLVGGCVRDLLLDRVPKDFDIATSARPRQVKRIFRNCRVIGRRFRLAHVIFGDKIIEVSTFRQAADTEKPENQGDLLIRDDNVFGTPEEDARRRDFTINGLFYDIQQGTVIDYVGGLHDLERRTLRMIGDPDIRFQEDPIRILRAIKFSARLGVNISPKTMEFIEAHRDKISRSAPPRILEEVIRMTRGLSSLASYDLMLRTRVLEVVLPDVAQALKENSEHDDLYRRYLGVLDREVSDGVDATVPIVFGTYLLPIVFPPSFFEDDKLDTRPDGMSTESRIEEVLADLIPRLRLSRRDAGRLRQILMAQRRLAPSSRKRRFSRSSVARQAYFPEALTLFAIHCSTIGKWTDECGRWKAALEAQRERDEEIRRQEAPRRRRRGGSGRSRGNESSGSGEGGGNGGQSGSGSGSGRSRRRRRRRKKPPSSSAS